VIWVARYTFSGTGDRRQSGLNTEMELGRRMILRQVDRFSFWRCRARRSSYRLVRWVDAIPARWRAAEAAKI